MRKIVQTTHIDLASFQVSTLIYEVLGKGKRDILFDEPLEAKETSRYTPEEQETIDLCNKILADSGKSELSEEEIDYMLDPIGLKKLGDDERYNIDNQENLQKLAGFKVEKKVISLDSKDQE
jgi:hypothetical protein